jgi:aldose 1-epimerase
MTMTVHAGDRAMPASCGWHPWWNRFAGPEPLELDLRAGASYRKDGEGIPTGELGDLPPHPWDDCFTELDDPAAVLRWPGAVTVALTTSCPCVVAYDEPAHAICVEPQTAPPDAFNQSPTVLQPGDVLGATATWRWTLTGSAPASR